MVPNVSFSVLCTVGCHIKAYAWGLGCHGRRNLVWHLMQPLQRGSITEKEQAAVDSGGDVILQEIYKLPQSA